VSPVPAAPLPTFRYAATVARVIDGDSVDVVLDLGCHVHLAAKLRLEHIDAPERGTPGAAEATAYLRDLLPPGLRCVVETSRTEKYGRRLAVIWIDDTDPASVNDRLIRTGNARPYDGGRR
jgi:micrococcal nuclease